MEARSSVVKFGAAMFTVVTLIVFASFANAQECSDKNWKACKGKPWVIGNTMDTPVGDKWWPNKLWGKDDQAGSTNWYTKPEVVQRALAEAKTGKTYRLGRVYTGNMPAFGERKFVLRIPGGPTGGPFGANVLVYNDEFVATEIGQIGTQFDGLGHIGVAINGPADKSEMRYYNGFTQLEIEGSTGLKKLGVEKLHPIVARGALIDVAALKNVDSLEAGYEITLADVNAALEKQGMKDFKFLAGDGVFFRTGWGKYWITDNAKYNGGEPGIGMEVAKWLSDVVQAGVTGADNWGTEVIPNKEAACAFCVHSHLLTRHGIVNQENMDLDGLSKDKAYRFLYMYSPTPIAGATGSPGAPLAIR
jgi:kynurenine formamidase